MSHRVLILFGTALVMSACGRNDAELQIVGTLERDRLELIAEANEPIVEIRVREGDAVAAGTVLVRQELGAMQARLEQSQAVVRATERRLAELISGPRAQEIIAARAARDAAQSGQLTAANEYGRIADLVARRLLSQSALDNARAQRDAAAGAGKQAQARLDLLLEGTRREAVEQAEATLAQARAMIAERQRSAERYLITAPRAGRIEAIPFKLGERPNAGAPLIIMLADGAPYARVFVPEPRRAEFAAGQAVDLRIDGRDTAYTGVVRFISAQAAFTPYYALTQQDRSRLSFLAEIDVTDGDSAGLPTGIPVQVTAVPQGVQP